MANELVVHSENALSVQGQDSLTGMEGFKPARPSMARAKIVHRKGVFELTEKDGSKALVPVLSDVVLLEVSSGRIRWKPQHEGGTPGDGEWTCRSKDGVMPEGGGSHTGPCDSCPAAQWGPKVNGKARKPECDETINLIFGRKNADPVLISFSKTSLKPIRDFLTTHFVNEKRPLYVRYVTLSLREETFAQNVYQVVVPLLGGVLSANDQKSAYAAARAVKGLSGENPETLNTDNQTSQEEREQVAPASEARTIEVQAKATPAANSPNDRLKTITEAAKASGKTLADAIKAARETFGCGIPQLTEDNVALLLLSLKSGMDISDVMAVAQENADVSDPKAMTVDMVEMVAAILDIPW